MAYVGKAPQSGRYSILDDIASSFNGTLTSFNLTVNGSAISPGNEANCIISLSSVVQEPVSAFTVTNSQITFASAPASGETFFGTVLGDVFDIGTPTDATVTAASLNSAFFTKNAQSFGSINLTGSENGSLVGPITINDGATFTVPDGATFVIL